MHSKNPIYRKTQKIVFPVEEGVENIEYSYATQRWELGLFAVHEQKGGRSLMKVSKLKKPKADTENAWCLISHSSKIFDCL